jgi:3-oxoacyl-[acyl-carrier protein] reductase
MRFSGRRVVVTGASRGLGRHLAVAFAREGAFVALGHRSRREEAEETLRICRDAGGDGDLLAFDVRDREAARRTLGELDRSCEGIDVLVNNAGVHRDALFAVGSPDDWDEVLSVNVTGVYNCTHAVARPMMARRRGTILNVASVSALRATDGRAAYATSKSAVIGFTRSIARELAPSGIRVNAIVPGYVDTGMAARLDWNKRKSAVEKVPVGRFATPDEICSAALFLASDDARYVVGHALVVDGGLSL